MPKKTDLVHHERTLPQHLETPSSTCCLVSRRDAAAFLGISARTFDRLQKDNAIPYVLIRKRRRYLVSDLDSYVRSNRSI